MNQLINLQITVSVPDAAWKAMNDEALDAAVEPFQDMFDRFENQIKALAARYGFEAEVYD